MLRTPRRTLARVGASALLCAVGPAFAANDAALDARALAATCAACHGTDGHAVAGGLPGLAGRPAADLIGTMNAYRSGALPATVMHQIARGYSAAQIEQIAAYYAAVPR